jgi:hypothetical protein
MPGSLPRCNEPGNAMGEVAMAKAHVNDVSPSPSEKIRRRLRRLDESDSHDVTSWEANFIDSVVYQYDGPLSQKQIETAEVILDRYGF